MTKLNGVNKVNRPIKVVQFGEGNFLRAFVDWMIDKMNNNGVFNGNIAVIQPIAFGNIDKLKEQNYLYTVSLNGILNGKKIESNDIISSISQGINPYSEWDDYIELAKNPSVEFIISNTTEAGIAFDKNDKLDDKPQNSFPGKVTAFLYNRFKAFNGANDKGIIIIPCELIHRNGDNLKLIIEKYIELWNLEDEFKKWFEENIIFCNTLVDRIVPGFPKDKYSEKVNELGYEDNLLVEAEPFHLWVIEGPKNVSEKFPAHKVGLNVLWVDDMEPYRTRKVRMLNGLHTSMVPVGYLFGTRTVKETVEDSVMSKFVNNALEEILPTIDMDKDELNDFANQVIERFKNPFIRHELAAIALNSIAKYETRVLPSLIKYVEKKEDLPKSLVFSLAALIVFYKGELNGEKLPVKDYSESTVEFIKSAWAQLNNNGYEELAKTILGNKDFWKIDLNEINNLTVTVAKYIESIVENGMKEAVLEVL